MLFGISGYAQSGKDTLCNILIHHGLVSNRFAFADPIKKTCNALFNWDDRHSFGELKEVDVYIPFNLVDGNSQSFYDEIIKYGLDKFGLTPEEIKNRFIDEICFALPNQVDDSDGIVLSPRLVYQIFGTEVGRNVLDTDVWVKIAPTRDTAIPDVRFPNELVWARAHDGFIMRVVKDDATPVRPHVSESHISSLEVDLEIANNGTLYELESKVIEYFGLTSPRLHQ